MSPARITVGIPLYRSAPFLDSLLANCAALAAEEDIEVIISDRHGYDDTIDTLEAAWAHDTRFRFLKSRDRLNWVEHMNLLLAEAHGEYFRWMPHDDVFPPGCLAPLIRRLDSDPTLILVYAPTRAIDASGNRVPERDRLSSYPVAPGKSWSFQNSLDLFWTGSCDGGLKGLFRRRAVIDAGFTILPTHELIHAERAWLFGVSLLGGLGEEPASEYFKRYHPDSTHAQWHPRTRHLMSATWTLCRYLLDSGRGMCEKLHGTRYTWTRMAIRICEQTSAGAVK